MDRRQHARPFIVDLLIDALPKTGLGTQLNKKDKPHLYAATPRLHAWGNKSRKLDL
jgi:hypothetical protein